MEDQLKMAPINKQKEAQKRLPNDANICSLGAGKCSSHNYKHKLEAACHQYLQNKIWDFSDLLMECGDLVNCTQKPKHSAPLPQQQQQQQLYAAESLDIEEAASSFASCSMQAARPKRYATERNRNTSACHKMIFDKKEFTSAAARERRRTNIGQRLELQQAEDYALANETLPTISDDTTVNELASYFETMLDVPKEMSTMAQSMYL